MDGFNINDYIWYIVGEIALFFVLVGFIADKSGLAKKTFSKSTTAPRKKQIKEIKSEELDLNSVAEADYSDVGEIQNNDVYLPVDTDIDTLDANVELPDEVSFDEIQSDVQEDSENKSQETIYLNDESQDSEESLDILGKTYLEIDESVDETEKKINSELEQEISVAAEEAEEEWGISESDDLVQTDDLEEVKLPDLSDLNASEEEDVWKF